VRKNDKLSAILCRCHEIWNLKFLEHSGPLQACNGTALPFQITYIYIYIYICLGVCVCVCVCAFVCVLIKYTVRTHSLLHLQI